MMSGSQIEQKFLNKLSHYRQLSIDYLLKNIPDKEPRAYLYDLITIYPKRAGKGFRPGLCISNCIVFGGSEEQALNSAISLELFHNAFLVHDDVEDESDDRRGQPTLHKQFGVPIAVNVGDAMNVLSIKPLMNNLNTLGPALTWQIFTEIEHMVLESVEGQAIELGWRKENVCELTEDDYLRMILKKTCWYTCIHPIRMGAIIGAKGAVNPESFNRFGYYLGAAFQIQDDLLNLSGDQEKYGKEICGDILEGKRTLMLIYLLNSANRAEKHFLKKYLEKSRSERAIEEVQYIMQLMEKYKSIEKGRIAAQNLAGAALKEFYSLYSRFPASEEKDFLENMILYMIDRDR